MAGLCYFSKRGREVERERGRREREIEGRRQVAVSAVPMSNVARSAYYKGIFT